MRPRLDWQSSKYDWKSDSTASRTPSTESSPIFATVAVDMRRRLLAVLIVVLVLVVSIWWNSVDRNPYAGAAIAVSALALAVWLGNLLGKVM